MQVVLRTFLSVKDGGKTNVVSFFGFDKDLESFQNLVVVVANEVLLEHSTDIVSKPCMQRKR